MEKLSSQTVNKFEFALQIEPHLVHFLCQKIIIPEFYLSVCGYVATFSKKLLDKFYINRRDLLVVTAQILLNALRDGIVSVTDFSLMVFDECHHTNDNHSYNMIMNRYLDIKLQDRERAKTLPMVLYQSFYNIYYC